MLGRIFKHKSAPSVQRGFTIVELLIVIVVIGILAALVIVAYTGVAQRATIASLNSDLDNSSKLLQLYQVANSGFPVGLDCSATPAASTICLKGTGSTTYQYSYNNAASPQTFCITATNGATSYYIGNSGAPASGACAGQVAGGSITNLATNPSLEANLTGWSFWPGTGGAAAATNPNTGGAESGTRYGRLTWSAATTSIGGGPSFGISATAGTTYSGSFWVRSSKAQVVSMQLKFLNSGGGTISTPSGTAVSLTAGVWTNVSYSTTAPALTTSLTVGVYASSAGGSNWLAADYLDYDAAIVTAGPTQYNFADGNTAGWSWTGTINSSTSTGPPQ